ncbi:hypothetical protein AMJ83_08010 [candidate division WOR_3 bacterium SM23_42]|uniref:DNA repair protein RecO n=1 Tax=candidate division WOR_3 bacterium SM23_42 TaxID=1703779 RepID=A0A0S8FTR7_UNCW3|nr:MAG: hypothetical protein AMJ83_08010 [candidate division WOR_3 bacterium SM23_42]
MTNIIRCRGLILKTTPFKESSLIASVLTDISGKVQLLAKGVRRPKSKICGAMEPFNLDEIIYYKREFKEMYNLSDAVVIDDFEQIRNVPKKVNAALVLCEFYNKTVPPEDVNAEAFSLLLNFLKTLEKSDTTDARSLAVGFLVKALSGSGVMPHLENCVCCRGPVAKNNGKIEFSISAGGIVCHRHHDDTVVFLKRPTFDALKNIYSQEWHRIDSETSGEIEGFLVDYMYVHLNHTRLNTLKYLK